MDLTTTTFEIQIGNPDYLPIDTSSNLQLKFDMSPSTGLYLRSLHAQDSDDDVASCGSMQNGASGGDSVADDLSECGSLQEEIDMAYKGCSVKTDNDSVKDVVTSNAGSMDMFGCKGGSPKECAHIVYKGGSVKKRRCCC